MQTSFAGVYVGDAVRPLPTAFATSRVGCVVVGRAEVGAGPFDAPVEERLAEAFRERRERLLDDVAGNFALLLWDEDAREGVLAVDPLGSRSIFFHADSGRLHFATEVHELLALLPRRPAPATPAVARWLAHGSLEVDQTLFDGVRRLAGGRYLRLRAGTWSEEQYWRPRYAEPVATDAHEAAAEIRDVVQRNVSARCARSRAGIMLSGGLDSAAVAGFARGGGVSGLTAYAAVFPDHPETDESERIEATAAELRLPARRFVARSTSVLEPVSEHVRAWALPALSPNLSFQWPLLALARDDGIEVMLDGQGGDELFGCSANTLAMRLEEPPPSRSRLRRSTSTWLTRSAEEAAGAPPGSSSWRSLEGPGWWAALADGVTAARERVGAYEHLRRKLAAVGLVGVHPLLDDLELIELVLRLPPDLACASDVDRPLLRMATTPLLSERARLSHAKSYFSAVFVDSLQRADRPALGELLGRRDARVQSYVRRRALRRLVELADAGAPGTAWAWMAWRAASIELWLRAEEG